MALLERLTKSQKAHIDAEQKKHDEYFARLKNEGRKADGLNGDAPTIEGSADPVVEEAIRKIWESKRTNG